MRKKVKPLIRDIYRRWREAMGIEQSLLAKTIGVSVSKLSKWEQDKANLTEQQIGLLGEGLRRVAEERAKKYAHINIAIGAHSRELFKQLRESYGISQSELAKRAGVLQFAISGFECETAGLNRYEEERAKDALQRFVNERKELIEKFISVLDRMREREDKLRAELQLKEELESSLRREVDQLEERQQALIESLKDGE